MPPHQSGSARMGDSTSADDECQRALEAAMGVAMEHCVPEEDLNRNIGRMLGVEPDMDCSAALAEGLNEETCSDFAGLRQWITCKAQREIARNGKTFAEAMEAAWDEAKEECSAKGIRV